MKTVYIATRGSALALAQATFVLAECRKKFPGTSFDIRIFKTTGDKLQSASLANPDATLPKGLFTKELEEALLRREASLAVHGLKDLPTILPEGLKLGAALKRADVRDVLIYRQPGNSRARQRIEDLPRGATVGTSSTRRSAQLLQQRPDLKIVPVRGNVGTRLQKLSDNAGLNAIVLAAAGLARLRFCIERDGQLRGAGVPEGLQATILSTDEMLPCVGQAAIGIEIRDDDPEIEPLCAALNDPATWHCVTAERAFLRGMGGGCQSPVAAHAEVSGANLRLRVLSFLEGARRAEATGEIARCAEIGEQLAAEIKSPQQHSVPSADPGAGL